jgi:hypothetical protein
MPAGPSLKDADAPVLHARNDLSIKFEVPIQQTG